MALHGLHSHLPTPLLLASIVIVALLLRVLFFVGLVSGDPQDDGVYYNNAFALYNDGPTYLERYRNLPPDFLANPIDQFHVRPMITYPIAATFALLGPGETQATLWALLCSLLVVVIVYRLGVVMHGRGVGLVAALLCSFYPIEVINGTRILSDVQVGLFTALGLLCLVEGARRGNLVLYALSGAAAGGAYLANGRGLVVLAVLLCGAALQWFRQRTDWRALVSLVGGFAVVFGLEALTYGLTTGDPLLSYRIQSGAARFKYLHEPVSTIPWGRLQIEYTNGRPFELLRTVFVGDNRPTDQFGGFFFLFLAAAVYSLLRRRNRLMVMLAAALFLYLEFGPVSISIDSARRELHYLMVYKQERFLLMLTAPLAVVAAFFVVAIGRRSPLAAAAVVLLLFATSLAAIVRTRDYYRAGLTDLRAVTPYVLELGNRPVFSDFWAVHHVQIFSGYRAHNLRVLSPDTSPADVGRGCVLLGGSRGVELLADYVEGALPAFLREIVDPRDVSNDWQAVATFAGPRNMFRKTDLSLYCVGGTDASVGTSLGL